MEAYCGFAFSTALSFGYGQYKCIYGLFIAARTNSVHVILSSNVARNGSKDAERFWNRSDR